MTGGTAATNILGVELARMDPEREIPRVFDVWEMYVREAGICQSLADLDFLEVHSFGGAPKQPDPRTDPQGYIEEKQRIRTPVTNLAPSPSTRNHFTGKTYENHPYRSL